MSSPAAAHRRMNSSACSSDPPASGSSRSRQASTCTRRTPAATTSPTSSSIESRPASRRATYRPLHPSVSCDRGHVRDAPRKPSDRTKHSGGRAAACRGRGGRATNLRPSDADVPAPRPDRRVLRRARRPRPPRPPRRAPGGRRGLRRPAHRRAAVADARRASASSPAPSARCRGVAGGRRTVVGVLARRPLPLLGEYVRLVRSLAYAYVWETWPDTTTHRPPASTAVRPA